MWTTILTFGLKGLFKTGDKAIDVRYIEKAVNRLKADIAERSKDGKITPEEWVSIMAHFIQVVATAWQAVKE